MNLNKKNGSNVMQLKKRKVVWTELYIRRPVLGGKERRFPLSLCDHAEIFRAAVDISSIPT